MGTSNNERACWYALLLAIVAEFSGDEALAKMHVIWLEGDYIVMIDKTYVVVTADGIIVEDSTPEAEIRYAAREWLEEHAAGGRRTRKVNIWNLIKALWGWNLKILK